MEIEKDRTQLNARIFDMILAESVSDGLLRKANKKSLHYGGLFLYK